MRRWLAMVLVCALPHPALADGRALASVDAVHEACSEARDRTSARLFFMDVEDGWHLETGPDGAVRIDTGRNFRALDGRVSVLVPREEQLQFERADIGELRGAKLRIGFFLGFDNRHRQPCLVRSRVATTIVRADVAYAELRDDEGERLSRAETDRLDAWNDDRAALAIPGSGPRGAVDAARFTNGSAAPAAWQDALRAAPARAAIATCHAAGVARGSASEARVVIRLNIETRTGRIRRADVALSSLGDAAEAECIGRALATHTTLVPGPSSWQAPVVDLAVTVRLVTE